MLGSSPARITKLFASDIHVGRKIMGYSQGVKAPVFDTGTAGSNPAIPAMIRYSRGSRGQSAKLLIAGWRQKLQPIKCNCPVGSCSRRLDGAKPLFSHKRKCKSNPARISIWSLRLVGQDASLSSWKYGFESRRDHQTVRHIGIYLNFSKRNNCSSSIISIPFLYV